MADPRGFTDAFSVALVRSTADAASVCTEGATTDVVNVRSGPRLVPAELLATMRKWYPTPAVRPLTETDSAVGVVADPAGTGQGALEPYVAVVPYSNAQLVSG